MWSFTPNASWMTMTAPRASPCGVASYKPIGPSRVVRVCVVSGISLLPEVERDLDRARSVLRGQGDERVTPVVEPEPMREHAGEVDATARCEVEVVRDAVLAAPVDLLEPE